MARHTGYGCLAWPRSFTRTRGGTGPYASRRKIYLYGIAIFFGLQDRVEVEMLLGIVTGSRLPCLRL